VQKEIQISKQMISEIMVKLHQWHKEVKSQLPEIGDHCEGKASDRRCLESVLKVR
jgi:hypothetical protein